MQFLVFGLICLSPCLLVAAMDPEKMHQLKLNNNSTQGNHSDGHHSVIAEAKNETTIHDHGQLNNNQSHLDNHTDASSAHNASDTNQQHRLANKVANESLNLTPAEAHHDKDLHSVPAKRELQHEDTLNHTLSAAHGPALVNVSSDHADKVLADEHHNSSQDLDHALSLSHADENQGLRNHNESHALTDGAIISNASIEHFDKLAENATHIEHDEHHDKNKMKREADVSEAVHPLQLEQNATLNDTDHKRRNQSTPLPEHPQFKTDDPVAGEEFHAAVLDAANATLNETEQKRGNQSTPLPEHPIFKAEQLDVLSPVDVSADKMVSEKVENASLTHLNSSAPIHFQKLHRMLRSVNVSEEHSNHTANKILLEGHNLTHNESNHITHKIPLEDDNATHNESSHDAVAHNLAAFPGLEDPNGVLQAAQPVPISDDLQGAHAHAHDGSLQDEKVDAQAVLEAAASNSSSAHHNATLFQ